MWTRWGLVIFLCAASAALLLGQEAKTKKTTHKSTSHHVRSTHHAKHVASKPTAKTEAYVNQGPVAPAADAGAELKAAANEPAVEAIPVVDPVAVTYERGALAITTHDAPLREVLDKVRDATGAVVEAPQLDQRVSVTVGAEAPVQAIAALLDGMHLDYAMLGGTSVDDPVRTIIIAPRGAKPGQMATLSPPGGNPEEQGVGDQTRARPAREH